MDPDKPLPGSDSVNPTLDNATCKLQTYQSETESKLGCFTNHAKCMTLSVVETSLAMQGNHDTLASGVLKHHW